MTTEKLTAAGLLPLLNVNLPQSAVILLGSLAGYALHALGIQTGVATTLTVANGVNGKLAQPKDEVTTRVGRQELP